ncbi:P1 family peptidase [Paenarthrobacter nitroguajacolicus]|uniref:P1 family peptidase n=1 Tax=Paenarthrobacter nitroguajacolicus TaxID=211146 RepID=UPI00248C37A0|nr:P1 family peptidase [Paenarthrobacter nitroguajacolicus]MDI2034532.1 putative aminopeptidase [Paenarthrobacter nitroguajacolicus]
MTAITDVPGIRVGHVQKSDDGWLSGVTVVLPPVGTVGSVDVRGGGPGTHETDALDPTTLVSTVDAVVLTGGSAFGLVSAHGAQRWCEEQGRGFAVPGTVVPIVPAAAIFDLGRGGDVHARPDADMGYQAAAAAFASGDHAAVERGNVGAGTGAVIARGQYKGGVGTSSITLDGGMVVGAIAVVNALGTPVVGPLGRAPGPEGPPQGLNTTLAVIATNAVLDVAECKRTASSGHAGLARALDPSHTLADGDTVFALATGAVALDRSTEQARQVSLITLQSAAAEVVRLAILDGVASAESITTAGGHFPAFRPAGE